MKMGLDDVVFTGKVPHEDIADYHNTIDIAVYVSLFESFGVSVLESSACEKPVIVSNIGGLAEIIENNKTGLIVESRNIQQTANAIERLVLDKALGETLGRNGRKNVIEKYNWENNLEQVITIYNEVLSERKM